jgi:HD-GYP domain-containing protein (c-di-GMP phosphodiesterase class II)
MSSLLAWIAAALAWAGMMGACCRVWTTSRLLREKASQHDQLKAQILEWNRRLEERASSRDRDLEQINQRLEATYLEIVTALLEAMSAKDTYLYGHSHNVAQYASAIAQEMGFSKEKVRRLVHGCELHDLGKIAVPDSVLMKTGPLTKEEFAIIKTHPVWGASILQPITSMKDITEMVHQEHERWDGTGYPQGLKGERIRLEARIIAVADALDAMLSHRPYRRSVSIDKAAQEVARCAGSHFDPQVVEACLRAIQEGALTALVEKQHPNAAARPTAQLGQSDPAT